MDDALDFIVIGARKSGTTSLFEHLRRHPELYLPPAKYHPFFSDDVIYAAGWPQFVSQNFCEAPAQTLWGKVTNNYTSGFPSRPNRESLLSERIETIIPERIHAMFPDVKLIAILRDPVDRCISDYGMSVLWGQEDRSSLDKRIGNLLAPAALESSRRLVTPAVITYGEYGRILEPYYELFGREQMLVCFTEELERAPSELMARLFGFLGVDPEFVPPTLQTRYREGALAPRFAWLPSPRELELKLATLSGLRFAWRRLPVRVRKRILLRMRLFDFRLGVWNRRRRGSNRLEASAETRTRLRAHYEADRVLLESLIGRPVPWVGDGDQTEESRPIGSREVEARMRLGGR
jgi:hypothetical protein